MSVEILERSARTPRVTYRFSALSRAFLLFWRAAIVLLPVILLNAIVQALLTLASYSPDDVVLNTVLAALSGLLVLLSIAVVTACAVSVSGGTFGWSSTFAWARQHWLTFGVWSVGLGIVVALGFALWTVPGILVLAVTPFMLIAAMSGERNALRANFTVLARKFWRWLVTTLIVVVVASLWFLISGFVDFFLRGLLGAITVWTVTGFFASWFIVAYALIYARGTNAD